MPGHAAGSGPAPIDIPTDLFIWSIGESNIVTATRIGGTPYMPKGMGWPERDGVQADYWMQFNFLESRELFSFDLPGDLMIVFNYWDLPLDYSREFQSLYEFVWIDLSSELTRPLAPLDSGRRLLPSFSGVRVRSSDCDDIDIRCSYWESLPPDLDAAPSVKIGGAPVDLQSGIVDEERIPKGARFLAQAPTEMHPLRGNPWPFVNRRAPLPAGDIGLAQYPLEGMECFYLLSDGSVHVYFSAC